MGALEDRIAGVFADSLEVQRQALEASVTPIAEMAHAVAHALEADRTIFLCGNGGSAAQAQHLAAELVVRLRPSVNRQALPAVVLGGDASTLTAAANDYGFDRVFARSIEALGRPEDVLIGLSTSGRSENVTLALSAARAKRLTTIGLLGGDGGASRAYCDLCLVVDATDPGRVQEVHTVVGHALVDAVEELLRVAGALHLEGGA